MEEKPGVTPILETMILSLSEATTFRISSSTRFTYSLVTSRRVPGGAFTLITNCPGSVRGKNETPSAGYSERDTSETPTRLATVATGLKSDFDNVRSYRNTKA